MTPDAAVYYMTQNGLQYLCKCGTNLMTGDSECDRCADAKRPTKPKVYEVPPHEGWNRKERRKIKSIKRNRK